MGDPATGWRNSSRGLDSTSVRTMSLILAIGRSPSYTRCFTIDRVRECLTCVVYWMETRSLENEENERLVSGTERGMKEKTNESTK